MGKKILRVLLYVVGAIVALPILFILVWFYANLYSPPLNPQIIALESAHPIPPVSENAYLAYRGLNAPAGEDPGTFALKRASELASSNQMFDEYDPDAPQTELEKSIEAEEKQFDSDLEKMACLLKVLNVVNEEPCASDADIQAALERNKLLLDRYRSLSTYPRIAFPGGDIFFMHMPYNHVVLHKMYIASMLYKSMHGRGEEAILDWIESTKFLNMALADEILTTEVALFMVNLNMNLKVLPLILNEHPALAKTYAPQITQLLSVPAFGNGGIELNSIYLAESRIVRMILEMAEKEQQTMVSDIPLGRFFYKENDTLNQLYGFFQYLKKETAKSGEQDYDDMTEEEIADVIKYQGSFTLSGLFYNPVGYLLLGGLYKGQELFGDQTRRRITNMRMLGAYVMALAAGITPNDMPSFISNLPETWRDPATQKPFLWDGKSHEIYYERTIEETPPLTEEEHNALMRAVTDGTETPSFPERETVTKIKRHGISFDKELPPSF